MQKIRIKDHKGLIRGADSNAVLSEDNEALSAYKKQQKRLKKVFTLEKEITDLKGRLTRLEALLEGKNN